VRGLEKIPQPENFESLDEHVSFLSFYWGRHTMVNLEGEEMFRETVKGLTNLKHCEFSGKNVLG
jgi:hypothetical protein